MRNLMKRSFAIILALVWFVTLLPTFSIETSAAQVNYVYSGDYIYNWGTRGTVADFLSPNAEAFYASNGSYSTLSSYSGGTGTSNAPNSALYKALQKLMKDAHDHITSYNETKNLYKYTDCQNNGGKISSFYSGKQIGPEWGNGWNREHTWPNSKGLGGQDENDIMMLRPTSTSENSSRGNKAYGKSSGYYNPNNESNGTYDLRGDVARIFLYVYVRWGNVNGNGEYTTWGSRGVMESLDVLLEWMEADPVDTWELGRNDSVESITGTRNVFVDYPEFAFLLFGEEIPANMTTPSGEGSKTCDHNNFGSGTVVPATCTTNGYTLYTCRTAGCGYSYRANVTQAKGHSYVSGACSTCGEAEPVEPAKPEYDKQLVVGKAYKLGLFSTDKGTEYYFTGNMSGYYGATDTVYSSGVDVFVENATGGYYLYFKSGSTKKYINLVLATGSDGKQHYNFTFGNTASSVYTWDSTRSSLYTNVSGEVCYIGTYGSYVTMGVLQSSKMQDSNYFARMYTMDAGSGAPDTSCKHTNTKREGASNPSCTSNGHTGKVRCLDCNATVDAGQPIPATGHKWVNADCDDPQTCSVCGATEGSALGHDWNNGNPNSCNRCGYTAGAPTPETTPGAGNTTAENVTTEVGGTTDVGETTDVSGTTDVGETTEVNGTTDGTQSTVPAETDPAVTTDADNNKKNNYNNVVIIIVVSVVAVAGIGVGIAIFINNKKNGK